MSPVVAACGELLIDVQRHYGMDFPHCVFLWCCSSVGAIGRRVIDIEKRLASNRDHMWLADFEGLGFCETERKALYHPTENSLPKLTPLRTERNFSTNGSLFLTIGISEHESNVAVCPDFYGNDPPSEVIPCLF